MILFANNLRVTVTGAGFRSIATVAIEAGLLVTGALRFSLNGRRTTGVGTCNQRVRIGGVDLLVAGAGDNNANVYVRGMASAQTPTSLRCNAMTSRSGAIQGTGLASINLANPLNLGFEIDLGTDSDVYTFDDLVVEYMPPPD